MSLNKVRQIVSGGKARFVDHENAVDLDLVYVTDRIIIMGYPATGFAGAYRNRRTDVLKFIESRHGEKWWVWNLCPLYENAYALEEMRNRVSRYPFPDHHPPPLPLLPLAVREMTAWLDGDSERIAIIHCKAGKGRSGTLLCSYLLSLDKLPPPPQLDRSYSHHELKQRIEARGGSEQDGRVVVGAGDEVRFFDVGATSHEPEPAPREQVEVHPSTSVNSSTTTLSGSEASGPIAVNTNDRDYEPISVGDEGAGNDVGQYDRKNGKVDSVFKLHSSRRMKPTSKGRGVSIPSQRRWCRYVNLLFSNRAPASYHRSSHVRLTSITIYAKPPSGWRKPIASLLMGSNGGEGKAWASVGRYDDAYVKELDGLGQGEGVSGSVTWGGVAGDGHFDRQKMFRSCGKMVAADVPRDLDSESMVVHHLLPRAADGATSIILDRRREFRLKFHVASVPLGWAWLIPAFHLPEPLPSGAPRSHDLTFLRSQIDFAVGPGRSIDRIVVRLEEIPDTEATAATRLMSEAEERAYGADDNAEHVREEGE